MGSEARQRIFVVSSDPGLRERLYDLLMHHGYVVTTIVSGQIGLETLQHGRPDLILANSLTHHCGGALLTDRVRMFDEQLPIILLGQLDEASLDPRTVRAIQACLPGDVPDQTLLATINRWLPPAQSATPIDYPGTILLVDDEPELLHNLEEFLQPRGCTIATATSGEEALRQVAHAPPSLVLLDIKMPGLDGLVVLRKIKETQPHLPIIMATAVEDQEQLAQAFALGAYEYITKPYNLKGIESILLDLKKRTSSSGA